MWKCKFNNDLLSGVSKRRRLASSGWAQPEKWRRCAVLRRSTEFNWEYSTMERRLTTDPHLPRRYTTFARLDVAFHYHLLAFTSIVYSFSFHRERIPTSLSCLARWIDVIKWKIFSGRTSESSRLSSLQSSKWNWNFSFSVEVKSLEILRQDYS